MNDSTRVIQAPEAWVRDDTVKAGTLQGGRPYQEDAFAWNDVLWAVADGMGGHRDGELAARVALEALCRTVTAPVDEASLRAGFVAANDAVAALAETDEWTAPGTTLVVLARRADGGLLGAWIGDSRAYLIHPDGAWEQVSDDHEDRYGGLTACLGQHGAAAFRVDTFDVPVGEGLKVLLCSDGLFGHLEPDELEELLTHGFEHLVAGSAETSHDNVTAVLIDADRFAGGTGAGVVGPTSAVPEPGDRMALIGGIDREALADPERREAELDRIALAMFRAIEGRDPVIEPSQDD